ncbi:threonyl-tRNA synthetase [Baffinella frigidus]|nr:threonyl-tRNA synthetase [Cryptophyta sp. CCMP2293]
MAMAVQRLFPNAKTTIGPWIDNGFFYDFDLQVEWRICWTTQRASKGFSGSERPSFPEDLKAIKKEMQNIIKKNFPITREVVPREEARRRIEAQGEKYKLELLNSIPEGEDISIYHIGEEWWDLCAGPHVEKTRDIPGKVAPHPTPCTHPLTTLDPLDHPGPYPTKTMREWLQSPTKRNSRGFKNALDLALTFATWQAGGGLVFWHPKGGRMRNVIETFWKDLHVANRYELVYSPHIANLNLWKTSGHFDFYKDGMFDQMTREREPTNCPFHVLMYKDQPRSYRQLPMRWAELGTVYRYERSGTLSGLFRVRGFTQDDAHIFCLPEQVADEITDILHLTEEVLNKFGFNNYEIMLSTRPEKSIGDDAIWDLSTKALIEALDRKGWKYSIDEGGGAFYGPKIDLKIRDAIGRKWQCSTVQCDFNLPNRFEMEYIAPDGSRQRPIMIHRAIFGSVERFFGILVENYAGEFPLWLAPEQMRLLPINDACVPYCQEVAKKMRAKVDDSAERLQKKIRNAELAKVPVTAVVGEKEKDSDSLAMRVRFGGTSPHHLQPETLPPATRNCLFRIWERRIFIVSLKWPCRQI